MRRREFIILFGGAVTAWPLVVHAQQSDRMRRVGVLLGYSEREQEAQPRVASFEKKLYELGWIKGRNIQFDYRFSGTDPGHIAADAANLVGQAPDVLLTSPGQVALALRQATHSIPIVFANVPDPVGIGLVKSLAHPGENVTGFTSTESELAGKWLEVLREIAPQVTEVAVIYSPTNPAWRGRLRVLEALAPSLGVHLTPIGSNEAEEIDRAVSAWDHGSKSGLIMLPSISTMAYRQTIIALAVRYQLPAVYPWGFVVKSGGLVSYGIDVTYQFQEAATYVDRILKGERAGDLPVQAPNKFDLAINLKTAKALGLTVPPALLARADEVIE
jgi:putative tryptophan/tyrosine transport system substrate-binding protein